NLTFDEDTLIIQADVIGSEKYRVDIELFPDGTIDDYECECPAYWEYEGVCKHIVAVLKAAQEGLNNKGNISIVDNKIQHNHFNNEIFGFFENLQASSALKEVKVEVILELEREYRKNYFFIELRIGEERLYVVKSIKEFIEKLDGKRVIQFGKNFEFNPSRHRFSETDTKIITLVKELYDNEQTAIGINPYSYNHSSAFKGKKLYLSGTTLMRLLNILKAKPFDFRMFDNNIRNIEVIDKDLPIKFRLYNRDANLVLNLDIEKSLLPMTKGGEYIYYEGKIYNPSEKQRQCLVPFINSMIIKQQEDMIFSSNDKERFVSEILPYVKNAGEVTIDPNLEESFYQEELNTKVYFDKLDSGISARIEFCYGEETVDPFLPKANDSANARILIRDVEKERTIIGLLEKAEFKIFKDKVYLEDEGRVFDFLNDILPELQEHSEVYYSDSFKKMTIKDPRSFSGRVRLNEGSDLLQFSFGFEGIDRDELQSLFNSIKEKKKYYRLKDGSFMPLESPEIIEVSELLDHLHISNNDLNGEILELPKYRALYIDKKLRESNLGNIERNIAFKQMVQNVLEPKDMDFEIPQSLGNILRDYQKVGFKWLKTLAAYGLGGILADDMGLGKTLETLAFIVSQKEKHTGPALVVAPTSLIYNWQAEAIKFTPDMNVIVVSGLQKERKELLKDVTSADIVVTSYPLIRRDIDLYKEMEFSYCFLDEAQHIKNPNSINAKSVKRLKAKGFFALTGTPIENSLTELWSIFDFILPGYLLSHGKFVKKYEKPIVKEKDEKALRELSKQIKPFVLRRMKREVLKELPEKIESKMVSELTDEQKKIYLAYLQQAKGEISQEIEDKGIEKSQIKILAVLTRLRQICCHPGLFINNYTGDSGKMLLLEELLEEALASGHRILLFSQFTSMLSIIKEHLEKEKIEYFYLDGSTKTELRGEMVKSFNDGKGKVFLISLKAGGTGLNLTGADMVIHFDPWWNPAVEDQASDRAHRIGQKNVVHVIKLITQGTIEEKVFELQQKKKEMIEAVIQPGETMLAKMTQQEIIGLFEQ
ncbi:MAG: DEAD/DEAH box helicase, partial [Lutispora sp.]|nr:DEAD/DEAH box helicase [Lutispora sp.]